MASGLFNLRHTGFYVTYEYDPPQEATEIDPAFAATAEIQCVFLLSDENDTDIFPFLSDDTIEELRDLIVEHELSGGSDE